MSLEKATDLSVAAIAGISLLLVLASFVYTSLRFDSMRYAVSNLSLAAEALYLQA